MKKINYFAPILLIILFSLLAVFIYSSNTKPQNDNNSIKNKIKTNTKPTKTETGDAEYIGLYKTDTTDAKEQKQTVTIEIKNDKSVEIIQSFANNEHPKITKIGFWERGSKGTLSVKLTTQNSQTTDGNETLSFVIENNGVDITLSLLNAKNLGWGEAGLFLKKQAPTSTNTLSNTKWVWIKTLINNDEKIVPSTPEKFTLTFNQNTKTVSITTDCNNIGEPKYQTNESNSLTIEPPEMTLIGCEYSNEGQFINDLTQVKSYVLENGNLFLQIKLDSGVMEFSKAN